MQKILQNDLNPSATFLKASALAVLASVFGFCLFMPQAVFAASGQAAIPIDPDNATTLSMPNVVLKWCPPADTTNVDSYSVRWRQTDTAVGSTGTTTDCGLNSETYVLESLQNETYEWYVVTEDASGAQIGASDHRIFTIDAPVVTQISPADGATVHTRMPVFKWEAVSGARGYEIVLTKPGSSITIPYISGVTYCSMTVCTFDYEAVYDGARLIPEGDWKWHVNQITGTGESKATVARSSDWAMTISTTPTTNASSGGGGPILEPVGTDDDSNDNSSDEDEDNGMNFSEMSEAEKQDLIEKLMLIIELYTQIIEQKMS